MSTHMREWSTAAGVGQLFTVADPESPNRAVGHCWMKGRLLEGDVLMCIDHTGDGFHDFVLLAVVSNGFSEIPQSRFGAYGRTLQPASWQISEREYHLLRAGEMVKRDMPREVQNNR